MKHYCVTYYDGKGERLMYVQAKSINAAKAAANDLLRKNKTIGAAVRKAERTHVPCFNTAQEAFWRLRKECHPKINIIIQKYDLIITEEYCCAIQETQEYIRYQTKSEPIPASEVARIIKERR